MLSLRTILIQLLFTFLICNVNSVDNGLELVAESNDYQWNGVALSKTNRIFAAFPRSYKPATISVAEISSNKSLIPYPGGDWNTFHPSNSSDNPANRFVNVNAILTDSNENLWVVDSGVYGNVTYSNGSKLVRISLQNNSVVRIYYTSSLNPPAGFALNDVRISSQYAYLTESGLGSLVIINLETGQVRRVLQDDSSTQFASPTVVRMEGRPVLDADGQPKKMPNNNLELSPDQKTLYYKPSFSFNWSAISTSDLLNETLSPSQLGAKVSPSWKTMPTGGTTMDDQGFIYLMDLERQAIWQQSTTDGSWKLIVRDDQRIVWGDASDVSSDGYLYVPMSQNNRIPSFNNGSNQVVPPFQIFRIKINSSSASTLATEKTFYFILLWITCSKIFS